VAERPGYENGHLVVAALRIFEAREGRPPTVAEVAALLPWHVDKVSVVVRSLVEMGAMRALESPYEARYEIAEHLKLEELERQEQGAGFADELAAFAAEKATEHEEMEELFREHGAKTAPRPEKPAVLDRQYADFKKKNRPKNPFGEG
jgi:hypothetical protein